jgi:hypothetical protein
MLAQTLDAAPGVRHGRGRPRKRPKKLHADKAYDHRCCRKVCRARSIARRIARRGANSSERLSRRENSSLAQPLPPPRNPAHEGRADIHEAFVILGCALICLNYFGRFGQVLFEPA